MILPELESRVRKHPEPLVVMGMGVPGTRKTELLRPLERIPDFPAIRLSPGRVEARLRRLDKYAFRELGRERGDAKVRRNLFITAAECLYDGNGVSVIYDAPNADSAERREDVEMFRHEFGAKAIVGVYFMADDYVAYERVMSKKTSSSTARDFYNIRRLLLNDPPHMDEGFDEIIYVDTTNGQPVIT